MSFHSFYFFAEPAPYLVAMQVADLGTIRTAHGWTTGHPGGVNVQHPY
jgi:hypothetical protein